MTAFRLKDILWAMPQPGPDVMGWLDVPSGLLFINAELDPRRGLKDISIHDPAGRALLRTISHETVHSLQIATTGFMYRWACEQHRLWVAATKPLRKEINAYVLSPQPKALLAMESAVAADARAAMARHVALLDRRGPNGISVRHLLEAHALVAEFFLHVRGLDAGVLLGLLKKQAPGLYYRLAYDLARCRLNDHLAFRNFLLIANLALCAEDPPLAFDELLDSLARSGEPGGEGQHDADWVMATAGGAVSGFIGTAAEVYEADAEARHPVYTGTLHLINEACGRGLSILDYFADPAGALELFADDVIGPVVLRPNDKHQFPIILPRNMERTDIELLLLLAVLASRVAPLGNLADDGGDAAMAWLPDLQDRLTVLEQSPGQVRAGDLGGLRQLDPGRASQDLARSLCGLWGRCALSFGIEDNTPLYRRADVQAYIRQLAHEQPAFPAYLESSTTLGMFVVWFGALADAEAWHGETSLSINHPSVTDRVIEAAEAIDRLARGQRLDASPLLQGLLRPYARAQVQQVLAALRQPVQAGPPAR